MFRSKFKNTDYFSSVNLYDSEALFMFLNCEKDKIQHTFFFEDNSNYLNL